LAKHKKENEAIMTNRRNKHPQQLFHECWNCHKIGLKPGILGTKHGDYGMRDVYKDEQELKLHESGLCSECEEE
jgi:hypothetical protein